MCTSLLADSSETEDAAQEIFIKAYRSLGAFRGNASFSTWIYRIATNHCKDLLRKRARQRTESWEALVEAEGEKLHQLLADSPDPRVQLESSDLIERVLSHVSPEYRLVLTLREVEGLSYQQISQTLGCSVDAVKARLRRARQELQDKVRHFLEPGNV